MNHSINQPETWRSDPSMVSVSKYKKSFAIFPVTCEDGKRIWLKPFYKKYITWGHMRNSKIFNDDEYGHTEFIENISEDEFLVRKLSERF